MPEDEQMKIIGEIADEKTQESIAQFIVELAQDYKKRANQATKLNAEANQRKEAELAAATKEGKEADEIAILR
jgi:predicted CopG family antitoxin